MTLQKFQSHFFKSTDYTHFNNSGQCLIPDVNRDKAIEWLDRLSTEAAFCSLEGWLQTEVTRKKLAAFLGAAPEETSFFQTTASALSQVAFGISLKVDDEILLWDQEYPSNFYPWRQAAEKNSARLVQVESDNWNTPVENILNRVNAKTRVIAVSWVQFQTGAVTNLKLLSEKLRGSGIWLVADVIQGVGVRPFNFHDSGFDVVCGGSHKWLCSGFGAAYMAIKKERMAELAPMAVGAMTYGTPDTPKSMSNLPKADASRYEPGTKSMVEIIAMGATLDLFSEIGMSEIYNEACRISELLQSGLRDLKYNTLGSGPILNFSPKNPNDLEVIMKKLKAGKVSYARRGPGLRLSAHAYNTEGDVQRVLSLLK